MLPVEGWKVIRFIAIHSSRGTDVTDGQIKVYAADSLEALKTADALTEGYTIEEKKSAIKTKINVTTGTAEKQFIKVTFGD